MKYTLKTLLFCSVVSLLTACGGDGDDKVAVEPVNSAPQAIAGVDRTVQEQNSVILDARASIDQDGDALSYQWTQVSGPAVILSNAHSVQPSFVTPEVDAPTDLVFEIQVSDIKQEISTDSITVTVLNQTLAQEKKQLVVHPVSTMLSAEAGGLVNVQFEYTPPVEASLPAGLMLKLHWNSSLLSFKGLNEVLSINHLGVSPEMLDKKDDDHNPDTDKYVIISWLDYENAEWLSDAVFPAALFSASFVTVEGEEGSTHVTLSSHFTSPSYYLKSQIVSVEL